MNNSNTNPKVKRGNTDKSNEAANRAALFDLQTKLINYFDTALSTGEADPKLVAQILKFLEMNDIRAVGEFYENLGDSKEAMHLREAFQKTLSTLPVNPWEEKEQY